MAGSEPQYACPRCNSGALATAETAYECDACGMEYPVEKGVPVFVTDERRGYYQYLNEQQGSFTEQRSEQLWSAHKKEFRNALDLLSEANNVTTVLDVGAGGGGLVRMLHEEGYEPIATDINLDRMTKLTDRDVRAAVSTATDLPFPDNSIDAVCLIAALPHLPEPSAVFAEANRVLRSGGSFVVDCYNIENLLWRTMFLAGYWERIAGRQGWHYFQSTLSRRQFRELATDCGFHLVSDRSYMPLPRSNAYLSLPLQKYTCLRTALRFEKR